MCAQRSQSQKCSTPEIRRSDGAPLSSECAATDSGRKRKNLPPASQRKAVAQAGFAHFGCNFRDRGSPVALPSLGAEGGFPSALEVLFNVSHAAIILRSQFPNTSSTSNWSEER